MRRFIVAITGALLFAAGTVGLAVPAHAAPAHRLVYVANLRGNSVSAYDPATGTVAATTPVGSFPEGVAVSPTATTSTPSTTAATPSR